MNLHEYQSKQLFARYGIPVPTGHVAASPDEAARAAIRLGGSVWVVKAQVHAGGRGKAGGVKLAKSPEEVSAAAAGHARASVSRPSRPAPRDCRSARSTSSRARRSRASCISACCSTATRAASRSSPPRRAAWTSRRSPRRRPSGSCASRSIRPRVCRARIAARSRTGSGLEGAQIAEFEEIARALYRLYLDCDCSLVEVNPLIVTGDGHLVALDAKINIEDNALFRQKELLVWRDPSQEDEMERHAAEAELNYVSLDGDIACMVNGAGLAMATMDLIKLHGGAPANFLDVGGGATRERVTTAFKLILSNPKVKAILVNIFGGIVRCDMIAEGVIGAARDIGIKVPVVVRIEGTNAPQGRELLAKSGLALTAASDLTDAAKKVVAAARGKR